MPPRPIVGSLAQGLIDALGQEIDARERVIEFIQHLLPDWRRLFPEDRCWKWLAPTRIDIWGTPRSDTPAQEDRLAAVATALHYGGFVDVVLHGHPSTQFLTCRCPIRNPS